MLRGYDTQSSTFVDGLRDIAPSIREMFNVESIEVIQGPDSAFAGRGGAGGTINIYTKQPRNENFFVGTVGLGSDSYRRATVDWNQKFGESGAIRLNLMDYGADVPGRNGPNNKRWGVAPSVSWGLGTPTRVTLSYYHLEENDIPDGGVPYNLPATSALPRSGVVNVQPTYGGNRNNWYGLYARDFLKSTTDALTAIVEHDISGDMKIRNITRATKNSLNYAWTQPDDSQGNVAKGMVWRRVNSSAREVETLANATELKGTAQTGGIKHSYVAGLELSREKAANDSYTVLNSYYSAQQKCPGGVGARSGYVCTSLNFPNPSDPWLGTLVQNNNPANYTTDTASL